MLHRYGSVAEALALRLLSLCPGDRLQPVAQLAVEFGTGRGTVQAALQVLVQENAVRLESRGKLGSYVVHLDKPKLLARAGASPLVGAMPVAYSPRFQGLAAGLTRAFDQAGLPLALAQLRGGRNRIHFLRTGRCDFAVLSRMAYEAESEGLRLIHAFGPGSNVGDHVLLFRSGAGEPVIRDGMRVGVDPSSLDHVRLTQEEAAGRAVDLVPISYAQAVPKLMAGDIDAALWDEAMAIPPQLPLVVAPRRHRSRGSDPNTEAVLVTRADAPAMGDLLARRVDSESVIAVQRRVIAGAELPVF